MEAPKCRLCQRNHWLSVACNGIAHGTPTPTVANGREAGREGRLPASGSTGGGCSPGTNTPREGRRVLKGSTGRGGPAKPTRTPATAKANPPQPAPARANEGTGETPAGGTAKPRRGKKKATKRKGSAK